MNVKSAQSWSLRIVAACFTFVLLPALSSAQSNLQVTYGSSGLQTLSYQNVILEDVAASPSDAFHIWHMKATDLGGSLIGTGQYGWGESNNGVSWDSTTKTKTYTFSWGRITTQFVQTGDKLDVIVTETNNAGSGIIFDGAEIYPLALHFPQDPKGFNGYNQYAITTTGPGVSVADYGAGIVTSVIPNEAIALYGGWKTNGANTYTPLMTTTAPDGLATFLPSYDQPVQPGSSLAYTVSLRFTPEGTPADASDAYASFAAKYPSQMTWTDKRIIGTAYLASSPSNADITQPGGFPTNPRRYFNDASVDITSASGLQAFQDRMLAQAVSSASNAQAMNGQGVMTWDIEGEEHPQSTSYVCSPDQIASVAPEMESIIANSSSTYFGRKLDDAYFQIMSNAGLKIGLCLRPQMYTQGPNGTASQNFLSTNAAIIANLEHKARYANSRWGATLFYVDSTVDTNGGTLDPAIFQQLITDMPNVLFIPEETTPRYYAYSAPFYSFLFHTDLGTAASTHLLYPKAFGVNLVNDVSASTLSAYTPQLTQSVTGGDILMGHADYWQDNDPTLVSIYKAAGISASPPVQVTPTITWPTPAGITFGTALSANQLDATANVAGTFRYNPAVGFVPATGTMTLQATFTPSDTVKYATTTATSTLRVASGAQATPTITWAAPRSIVYGSALSAAQLNAAANVPGRFTYSPSLGTVLSVGTKNLQVSFTPLDTVTYRSGTSSTSLVISPAAPRLTWSTPVALTYGTALSKTQLNATANVAGTFSYNPALGTVPAVGTTLLHVTFTPTDAVDYTKQTATITLTVKAASVPLVTASNLSILSPSTGMTVSGIISVGGQCKLFLDSAGTYLMVDGVEAGIDRVMDAPWVYGLDTTTLGNGPHILQLWGHDTGDNTTVSAGVTINVIN
jgi:hypothetical protein